MRFTLAHNNINVLNLDASLAFYRDALGLVESSRINNPAFTIVYLSDGTSSHKLELTWMKDRTEPYNLGENEFHLAFYAEDFDAAHALHSKMGCICYENTTMGIYFINDPDGYWLEVVPRREHH